MNNRGRESFFCEINAVCDTEEDLSLPAVMYHFEIKDAYCFTPAVDKFL
jgi:hypothetical protein